MYKIDLGIRLDVIRDLERKTLQQPNRLIRRKLFSQLMSARENLRLQYYNNSVQDAEIISLLNKEATSFIQFQENYLNRHGSSNAEFAKCLSSIMDTCKQTQFTDNTTIITQAQQSFDNISQHLQNSSNIMRDYRLRNVKRCQSILNQHFKETITNKPRSLDVCTGLDKEELGD